MKIELVDLVDKTGTIQKQKILRKDADSHNGLYLPIIIGVIFNPNGEILVQKRALAKKVNPGDIDLICGGIRSGETPEEAAIREAIEETGIAPTDLQIIAQGVNNYNRYRYLLIGNSSEDPNIFNPEEVEWVRFIHLDELRAKSDSKEFTYVNEFFEVIELAKKYLKC